MKIIHEHDRCIGCGSCAALCPKYWEMTEDGKAKLLGSKKNSKGNYEIEINNPECNEEATDSCPVQCIIIEKQ